MNSARRCLHLFAVAVFSIFAACSTQGTEEQNFLDIGLAGILSQATTETVADNGYEAWKAKLYQEPEGGPYIVDGDVPIYGEENLRAFYDKHSAQTGDFNTKQERLVVQQSMGKDNIWNDVDKKMLTYCVSYAFGNDHRLIVNAMREAGRAWARVADVRFLHLVAEDENCDSNNNNVLFDVKPAPKDVTYKALAFFPNEVRRLSHLRIRDINRNLKVEEIFNGSGPLKLKQTMVGILKHELGHILGFRHEHVILEDTGKHCSNETLGGSRPMYLDAEGNPIVDRFSVMFYPRSDCLFNGDKEDDHVIDISLKDAAGASELYGPSSLPNVDSHFIKGIARSISGEFPTDMYLSLNDQEFPIKGPGEFVLETELLNGNSYLLQVFSWNGQTCIINGNGSLPITLDQYSLNDLVIECMPREKFHSIGGKAQGLGVDGSVELELKDIWGKTETIEVSGDGSFVFSNKVKNAYSFHIKINSVSKHLECELVRAQGQVLGSPPSGIQLNCRRIDLHVPRDYPTIQAAIEAAHAGDTIRIASGNYTENIKPIEKQGLKLIGDQSGETIIESSYKYWPGFTSHGIRIKKCGVLLIHVTLEKTYLKINGGRENCKNDPVLINHVKLNGLKNGRKNSAAAISVFDTNVQMYSNEMDGWLTGIYLWFNDESLVPVVPLNTITNYTLTGLGPIVCFGFSKNEDYQSICKKP